MGDLVIPPGAHWLLATSADAGANGGLVPDLVYTGLYLSNSGDEIILVCSDQVVDAVSYDGASWPLFAGRALALDGAITPTATANDDVTSWCAAPMLYAVGNHGTPGEANPQCPTPDDSVDACRLVAPESLELLVGTEFTVLAQVFDEEVTDVNPWVDAHPDLVTEAGLGPADVHPATEPEAFVWYASAGTFGWDDAQVPGWDQYEVTLSAPETGSYQVLARFSLDGGQSWTNCDLSGSEDGYDPGDSGQIVTAEDPCEADPCAVAPAATCSPDGAAVWTPVAPGACSIVGLTSQCDFEMDETDCVALGGTCEDGACQGLAPPPAPGEIIFTEIMTNPNGIADTSGEWFELLSLASHTVNLQGCTLQSGGEAHTVDNGGGLLVQPGQTGLYARNGDSTANGGLEPDYVYSLISLSNLNDDLSLHCDDALIDTVAWSAGLGFPLVPGQAMQLALDAYSAEANDSGDAWCAVTTPYTDDNTGSPGEANPPCPVPDPCEDIVCNTPPPDSCDFGVATIYQGSGSCADGACSYAAATTEDCAEAGLLCTGGVCTDLTDPCLPNPCTEPPAAVCEGDVLMVSTPVGTCDADLDTGEANCDYTADAIDCASLGTTCIDGACDGVGVTPLAGSVIFTEVLVNPEQSADSEGEWLEILNTSDAFVDLSGCVLEDNQEDLHALSPSAPFVMGPGELRVLAASPTPAFNGGLSPDYAYGTSFLLANDQDEFRLRCGEVVIDQVSYDAGAWGLQPGVAWQLDAGQFDEVANDDASAWCLAYDSYGKGDLGTPGAPNPACPTAKAVDWCRIEAPMLPEVVLIGDEVQAVGALRESPLTDVTTATDPHPWILVQLAAGPSGSIPEIDTTGWFFVDAEPALAWSADEESLGVDKYVASWFPEQAGDYDLAYRISVDRGLTWTYCDRDTGVEGQDGSEDGYATDNALQLTVSPSPCEPNPCLSPPPGACSGDVLTFSPTPGDCAVSNLTAACTYVESTMDCAAYGGTCSEGACVDMATTPAPGEVIISELMIDPVSVSDEDGEWIELLNVSDHSVLLDGCRIADVAGGDDHEIAGDAPLLLEPGGAAVLGKTSDLSLNGGVTVDYAYGGSFILANDGDSVIVRCDGQIIDEVHVDATFPTA
ncbi:MAG: lamin tail domain-containing protein, partial [Myxococcota bacterium]|nr:lamin tail domain-containing protein [Myxococcota bacterium]